MDLWMYIAVLLTFCFSALGVSFFISFARSWGVLDVPALPKKQHKLPTPLWGGVAPLLVFLCVSGVVQLSTGFFTAGSLAPLTLWAFFAALLILLLGGMWDDARALPPWLSFLFPLFASLLVVCAGMGVSKVTNPLGGVFLISSAVSSVVTFLWLLCVTYTTKLLDGVDGLASGVGIVGAFMIALLALSEQWYQPDIAFLSLLFLGSLGGFFIWNVAPAKVFLGEAGSTMIGFTLAALAVMGGSKFATLLLVVGLPAIDVAFVMVRRVLAGRSPFHGGDGFHLHTMLQRQGWNASAIGGFYLVTAFLFGSATLFSVSWQKMLALLLLACFSLAIMSFYAWKTR